MTQIDSHQHFWQISRGDYGWLTPDQGPLYRDFGPGDLAPLLAGQGVGATILVQAASTTDETRFLLDIARRTEFVAGVVGWADLAAPDAPAIIADLARDPLLVGLRPMVQDIEDDDWLLRRDLGPAIEAMIAENLTFDALTRPRHLPRLAAFLDRHPRLAVVLDHAGKPAIGEGGLDPWRADLAAIAARPRAFCKISGLPSEAGPGWTTENLAPFVDHLLAVFGPRRLMWGSDWPVVTAAASYETWRAAAGSLLAGLGGQDRAAVFGANAARFYLGNRGRRIA